MPVGPGLGAAHVDLGAVDPQFDTADACVGEDVGQCV